MSVILEKIVCVGKYHWKMYNSTFIVYLSFLHLQNIYSIRIRELTHVFHQHFGPIVIGKGHVNLILDMI